MQPGPLAACPDLVVSFPREKKKRMEVSFSPDLWQRPLPPISTWGQKVSIFFLMKSSPPSPI